MEEVEVCWPGRFGFLLLEYIGQAPDDRWWPGPETGAWYQFGPGVVRYVDKRDGLRFLVPQGGGRAFKLRREGDDDKG